MAEIDHTHAPTLESWIESANGHPDFPIQNLPHCVFSPAAEAPRGGVGIGDFIIDMQAAVAAGLFGGDALAAAETAALAHLNAFLALGSLARTALRHRLTELLAEGAQERALVAPLLHAQSGLTFHVPARVGDYTDFYAGIHHARRVGSLFRPDNPLMPNYKFVPIGYHGRASSIRVSGTPVRRPLGQFKSPTTSLPTFGPCRRLDYELELGIWTGQGNELGEPIGIEDAADHISGFTLLNDWSARDIQTWEYQPLGPFLSKSFATTISPWIVTREALAPFRIAQPPRPEGDPQPMPYLLSSQDQRRGALDISLKIELRSAAMIDRNASPMTLAGSNTRHMYWTPAQLLAHHTSNGCNLAPGDLLGSGTISGPGPEEAGSLLELTEGGTRPIALPGGEQRVFLEDGDEIVITGRAHREGCTSIGLGECRARIVPAPDVNRGGRS